MLPLATGSASNSSNSSEMGAPNDDSTAASVASQACLGACTGGGKAGCEGMSRLHCATCIHIARCMAALGGPNLLPVKWQRALSLAGALPLRTWLCSAASAVHAS